VLLALLVPALVLATVPFVEMGLNDGWSYSRTAIEAARTGRLLYHGWSSPIVGFQAFWGALFVRLFGPSFTVLRLCTLPFSIGCALLLYHLSRRSGLGPRYSAFAAACLVCSPLFIPLAASFMTDVPGLFFSLASIVCVVEAVRSRERRVGSWLIWLSGAAFVGWLGGTVRQFTWLAPLAAVNTALLGVRVLFNVAISRSFAYRGAPFWLSPLADIAAVSRVVETIVRRPREWRGAPTLEPARR
jgi:hypothetical protein